MGRGKGLKVHLHKAREWWRKGPYWRLGYKCWRFGLSCVLQVTGVCKFWQQSEPYWDWWKSNSIPSRSWNILPSKLYEATFVACTKQPSICSNGWWHSNNGGKFTTSPISSVWRDNLTITKRWELKKNMVQWLHSSRQFTNFHRY